MDRKKLLRSAAVALQLLLFLLVVERRFQVESPAFVQMIRLAIAGYLVHSLLPDRFRAPFFLLLSATAIVVVFGPTGGAWMVGIGLLLIGLCHAPVPFGVRVVLLVAVGGALAALRGGAGSAPWSAAIWPILGSMFMFRLIIYMYDLKHERKRPSIWHRLSCFFLLPNVCFPLFPVVDFQTYVRSYGKKDAHRVEQKGVQWMLRGLIHLVLYRLVYYYFTLPMDEVVNAGSLGRFLLTNYLLYLRISGQFHIIAGILCLFGYDLPRTNNLYLFASSFTDYWRRINIYWKDFMVKVFYYPADFRLRMLGDRSRLIASTAVVFLATWALHSYQWFWLRGSFPVAWPDLIFWSALGGLVIANSLREATGGRRRAAAREKATLAGSFRRASTTVGVLLLITVIWSLWTSPSISAWLSMWEVTGDGWFDGIGWVIGLLVFAIACGTLARFVLGGSVRLGVGGRSLVFKRSVLVTMSILLAIAAGGHRSVYARLGSSVADVIYSLKKSRLSRGDIALLQRGYYENLLGVERVNPQLWEVYMKEPANWEGDPDVMYNARADFLAREHKPLVECEAKGSRSGSTGGECATGTTRKRSRPV